MTSQELRGRSEDLGAVLAVSQIYHGLREVQGRDPEPILVPGRDNPTPHPASRDESFYLTPESRQTTSWSTEESNCNTETSDVSFIPLMRRVSQWRPSPFSTLNVQDSPFLVGHQNETFGGPRPSQDSYEVPAGGG